MFRLCFHLGGVHTGLRWRSLREIDHLKDPVMDRRIILEQIFETWNEGEGVRGLDRCGSGQEQVAGFSKGDNKPSGSIKCEEFFDQLKTYQLFRKASATCSQVVNQLVTYLFSSVSSQLLNTYFVVTISVAIFSTELYKLFHFQTNQRQDLCCLGCEKFATFRRQVVPSS